jgi:hypothetical protein
MKHCACLLLGRGLLNSPTNSLGTVFPEAALVLLSQAAHVRNQGVHNLGLLCKIRIGRHRRALPNCATTVFDDVGQIVILDGVPCQALSWKLRGFGVRPAEPGPSPAPCAPWQTVQRLENISAASCLAAGEMTGAELPPLLLQAEDAVRANSANPARTILGVMGSTSSSSRKSSVPCRLRTEQWRRSVVRRRNSATRSRSSVQKQCAGQLRSSVHAAVPSIQRRCTMGSSNTSQTSNRVTSSAGRASDTPPLVPRWVVRNPFRASVCTILARYAGGIPVALAMSRTNCAPGCFW